MNRQKNHSSRHDSHLELEFKQSETKFGKCSLCRTPTKVISRFGGVCYRCWSDVEYYHYYDWQHGKPRWGMIH